MRCLLSFCFLLPGIVVAKKQDMGSDYVLNSIQRSASLSSLDAIDAQLDTEHAGTSYARYSQRISAEILNGGGGPPIPLRSQPVTSDIEISNMIAAVQNPTFTVSGEASNIYTDSNQIYEDPVPLDNRVKRDFEQIEYTAIEEDTVEDFAEVIDSSDEDVDNNTAKEKGGARIRRLCEAPLPPVPLTARPSGAHQPALVSFVESEGPQYVEANAHRVLGNSLLSNHLVIRRNDTLSDSTSEGVIDPQPGNVWGERADSTEAERENPYEFQDAVDSLVKAPPLAIRERPVTVWAEEGENPYEYDGSELEVTTRAEIRPRALSVTMADGRQQILGEPLYATPNSFTARASEVNADIEI